MFDWSAFSYGMGAGLIAEGIVGAFITAPIVIWRIKRNASKIIDAFLKDADAVKKLRQHFVNAMFGGLGGRPPKFSTALKTGVSIGATEVLPAVMRSWAKKMGAQMGPVAQEAVEAAEVVE